MYETVKNKQIEFLYVLLTKTEYKISVIKIFLSLNYQKTTENYPKTKNKVRHICT